MDRQFLPLHDRGRGTGEKVPAHQREVGAPLAGGDQVGIEFGEPAAQRRQLRTGTVSEGGKALAQVAKPLYYRGEADWVVVFSDSLNDVADNVSLIQRQILIAGGLALIVALISGYYASNALL